MSRHPKSNGICKQAAIGEEFIRYVSCQAIPPSLSAEEIADETEKDADLQWVKQAITSGKWYPLSSKVTESFNNIRDELSMSEDGIIMRGTRICIPKALEHRVLSQAHDGYLGMNKTKALLRTGILFPCTDAAVESVIKICLACQASSSKPN